MKNLFIFLSLVCLATVAGQAQNNSGLQPKNEIKANVFSLLALSHAEIGYERLLNDKSSIGVAVMFDIDQSDDDNFLDISREFSITPYYRHFFSGGYAKGFFVEGFMMYNEGDGFDSIFGIADEPNEDRNYSDLALGVSVGGKFVTSGGFMVEVYGGFGRNFLDADFAPEILVRTGVALGYRF